MDVVLLGLPHKVSAHEGAGDHRRRARASSTCRATSACATPAAYEKYYGADAPVARRARRHVRLRPARAEPRGDQARRSTSRRPAASRRRSSSRSCRSRRRGCSTGAVEIVGITGSSGSGVAPSARHAPPDARRATCARTSRSSTSTSPRSRETLARRGREATLALRFVPVSRAALARHLRDVLRARRRQGRRRDAIADALRRDVTRASRSCACPQKRLPEVVAVQRIELRRGRLRSSARRRRTASALVACFAVIDNLIKGGAGQAIQIDEPHARRSTSRRTLEDPGGWP